jgi:stage II sporulation protein AA (anti-sigma F factor antagonist)
VNVIDLPRPAGPGGPALRTELAVLRDVVVVTLTGEVDIAEGDRLHDHLSTALMLAERAVVLDLSGLTFLDVAGLQVLARSRAEAFRNGVPLCIAAPSRQVARLFEVVGTAGIPVLDCVEAALRRHSRATVTLQRPALRLLTTR